MIGVFFTGNQLSTAGLKSLLSTSDFSPIGEATILSEAHRLLSETLAEDGRTDILLIDVRRRLSDDEEESLHAIHRDRPTMKMVVIGDALSLGLLSQKYGGEIDGYLLTEMSAAALKYSLRLIDSGQRIFPPGPHPASPSAPSAGEAPISVQATSHLSARELRVLQLLTTGCSNKAIARDLAISDATVKVHVQALLRKVNVQNRTQAALWAIEHGVQRIPAVAVADDVVARPPLIRPLGSDGRRTVHSFRPATLTPRPESAVLAAAPYLMSEGGTPKSSRISKSSSPEP
jgi:two-component system nitrate/nitrite response regulator NarL